MSAEGLVQGNWSTPPVRAVNLGGWLVVEGWIKPSLFDDIPNKDFLDGTQLQFKSVKTGKYLSAKFGGGHNIVADKTTASDWETFRLWRIDEKKFNFRVSNKKFVGKSKADDTRIVAAEHEPQNTEIFEIHRNADDLNRVRIKASNGFFLQVKSETVVSADYKEGDDNEWGDDDPSVFILTINTSLSGEYQLVNGHGDRAAQVLREHWNTFIVEEDFDFMKKSGINAVRIPVGWWTAYDPNPPKPYVAGSLQALDNAFDWAKKYGIRIILDLHAAPGSQSGQEPSSTRDGVEGWKPKPMAPICSRDGFLEWSSDDNNIQQSLDVIEFFVARYAKSPSLFAVELLNEPHGPEVDLDVLTNYYRRGYEVVRKYSRDAFVVMCDLLVGPNNIQDPSELLSLANELPGSVIDVHYYNVYEPRLNKNSTIQENIDYVKDQANEIKKLQEGGALVFIGEWVAEWKIEGATMDAYKRFAAAQLEVYGGANFGWAYWCLKNDQNHWSLEWMIKNGYISLRDN